MQRKKREFVLDVAKDFLSWLVVTAFSFVWWLAMLLIFSLILLSVWHVRFESILKFSFILMCITSFGYLVWILRRRVQEKKV